MSTQQYTLMQFDPSNGEERPWPSHALQWRDYHGSATAWLFNPWTGKRRLASDVGSDTFGYAIIPDGEPIFAAPKEARLYLHRESNGIYEHVIAARPAGQAKRDGMSEIEVYRSPDGRGWFRYPDDFNKRMTVI